jgi:hypothetical protein
MRKAKRRRVREQESADKLSVQLQSVLFCLIAVPDGLGSVVHLMAFGGISWHLAS